MDCMVHGVTESQTRPSDFHISGVFFFQEGRTKTRKQNIPASLFRFNTKNFFLLTRADPKWIFLSSSGDASVKSSWLIA